MVDVAVDVVVGNTVVGRVVVFVVDEHRWHMTTLAKLSCGHALHCQSPPGKVGLV